MREAVMIEAGGGVCLSVRLCVSVFVWCVYCVGQAILSARVVEHVPFAHVHSTSPRARVTRDCFLLHFLQRLSHALPAPALFTAPFWVLTRCVGGGAGTDSSARARDSQGGRGSKQCRAAEWDGADTKCGVDRVGQRRGRPEAVGGPSVEHGGRCKRSEQRGPARKHNASARRGRRRVGAGRRKKLYKAVEEGELSSRGRGGRERQRQRGAVLAKGRAVLAVSILFSRLLMRNVIL
eukprot:1157297-Rhodomonas_salina.1